MRFPRHDLQHIIAERDATGLGLGEESSFDLGLKIKGDGHGVLLRRLCFSFPYCPPYPAAPPGVNRFVQQPLCPICPVIKARRPSLRLKTITSRAKSANLAPGRNIGQTSGSTETEPSTRGDLPANPVPVDARSAPRYNTV